MVVTVRLVPGEGLVARVGSKVLVVPAGSPHVDVDALRHDLDHLDGTVLTSAVETAHGFSSVAVVAPGPQGWAVLVPGGLRIRTVYRERESVYDGPQHAVKTDPLQVWITPSGDPEPSAAEDLPVLAGETAKAGGVVLTADTREVPLDLDGTVVEGLRCTCQTLLPSTALRCWVCGEPVPEDPEPASGVRPTLGALVADDGQAHELVSDYVVGRDPSAAEGTPDARPLPQRDHSHLLSRAHALVTLDGWEVLVSDLSTNGTFVRPPDGWRWQRLSAQQPSRVAPGSDIRLGRRRLRFEPPGWRGAVTDQ